MSYTKHNFTAGGTILAAPFNAMEDQIAENETAIAGKLNRPSGNGTSGQILQTNGDGTTAWVNAPSGGSSVTVDATLNYQGDAADAQATGIAIAKKLNKPVGGNGLAGQILRTNGDGSTNWINCPESVSVDYRLMYSGRAADAKTTGDAIALKLNKPTAGDGTSGQLLQTNGDGTTSWVNAPSGGSGGGGSVTVDATLSNQGQAADAKATGDALQELQDAVDELSENVIVTVTLEQGNIFNTDDLTEGRLGSNGAIRSDGAYADYYTTPFERIVEGQTYSGWENYRGSMKLELVSIYDEDHTFIQNVSTETGANNTVIIPENVGAYYARFSVAKSIIDTSGRQPRIVTGSEQKTWSTYYNEEVETRVTKEYVLKSVYDAKIAELTKCYAYLPNEIYCAVGRTIDLYNNQVCINASKFHFQWICTKGFAEGRRFTITADAVEDLPLTLNIYDDSNTVVYTKSATIKCVAPLTTGSYNVVPIGDSMTKGGGQWQREVQTVLSSGAIQFVGTQTTNFREVDYHNEGVNGVSASWFLNSANKSEIVNPFYNSSVSGFDYSYYLANANVATPDAVMIELGTNDVGGRSSDEIEPVADNIVSIVTKIKTASASTPVFVCNAIYRSNQDGIAHQMNTQGYTASSGKYKYEEDLKIFKLMTFLAEKLANTSGVYFMPLALCHDSENNYGKQTIKLNSRSLVDITIPEDSIHPNRNGVDTSVEGYDIVGYLQFADVMFSVLSGVLGASGASS